MRIFAPAMAAATLLAAVGIVPIAAGLSKSTPSRVAAAQVSAKSAGSAGISVNGVTLRSTSIDLPEDAEAFPDGPNADIVNSDCRACHSASMVLYQPKLSAEDWKKEVDKMRNTFAAPVPEEDVPAIVAYLTAMSAKLPR